MVFSTEQARLIRQGKMTAIVLPVSTKVHGRLITFRRRVVTLGDSGEILSSRSEQVTTAAYDGDSTPLHLTLMGDVEKDVVGITLTDARACGFRTRTACIDEWWSHHPRTPRVRVVHFAIGDLRDAPRLLSANMARRNYTASPRLAAQGEPEALTDEQMRGLAAVARQKDLARLHERIRVLKAEPLVSERLAAIEGSGLRMRVDMKRELGIILERVERGERKLAGEVTRARIESDAAFREARDRVVREATVDAAIAAAAARSDYYRTGDEEAAAIRKARAAERRVAP